MCAGMIEHKGCYEDMTLFIEESDARAEGYAAFFHDDMPTDNPHEREDLWRQWLRGWHEAHREHMGVDVS